MCKIYNTIGSLTTIKSHLQRHNITEFNSLNELINFQRNYSALRQQIISNSERAIEQEKSTLNSEISQLNNFIETKKNEIKKELLADIERLKRHSEDLSISSGSTIQQITNYIKNFFIKRKIHSSEQNLNSKVSHSIQQSVNTCIKKKERYEYIVTCFSDAVNENCIVQLRELETKKRIIDEINTFIYGAIGEQKVVRELENLSEEYFLINDFSLSFNTPIYNRHENDYIKSIQIDHILISPSGIFLIETKNWSERSLNNLSLRSPVQQIKRTNFALFKILSSEISNSNLNINQHHWGERKIPIRNLIVLTNLKPNEEFQYVKILTLNELLNYVKYFKPTFSGRETEEIKNNLLNLLRHI